MAIQSKKKKTIKSSKEKKRSDIVKGSQNALKKGGIKRGGNPKESPKEQE